MERRNAWLSYTEAEEKELEQVAKAYRNFLNVGKTERECVTQIIREARAAGYESLEEKTAKGEKLKAGDKVYTVGMKKIIALFHIGQDDISEGMNILGAHIDSPRLDVKQNPLYEDTDLAYLDTHYYGGVKKYQWVTLPLAIHGVVVKKDGSTAEVNIGEDEDDPIVYITDLLIHLAGKQMQKKAAEVIEGENLDILIGSRPLKDLEDDKKKEAVKQNVLNILKEKYDMEEEDFLSAELEIVPAGKARECGLDRSMIAAYGQDDRVCAYTSLLAMLGMDTPKHTSCCLFTDKEEIGSVGATGMQSRFFENAVAELLDAMGCYSDLRLRRTLKNSSMLSSDVSAGCCQSLPHRNLHRSLRMYLHHQNPLNLQKYPQILQSPKNPDCPKSLPHRNLYLLHNHQNSLLHPVPVPLPPLLRPVPALPLWLLFPLLPAAQAEQCCYLHC